jgi:hypothetical protein
MFFQHHRFQVWNANQHPYRHNPYEIDYTHDALPQQSPQITTVGHTLDWLVTVLYPNAKEPVATPGDLPTVGNEINDYRVVNDDGDGKAASYRWEQREGDVTPQWYKVYDMDWGEDSILSNFLNATQDVYVYKHGLDDLDETGTPYAGDLAGQRVYGGATANAHLILYANAGDGVGPDTGFVQFGDNARPISDNSLSLGTPTYRFSDFQSVTATVGTTTIAAAVISDTTGLISFADENLTTTGWVRAGTLTISGGLITDTTGAISFDDENLTTTGWVQCDYVNAPSSPSALGDGTTVTTLVLAGGSITDTMGGISFDDENLSTTGWVAASQFRTANLYVNSESIVHQGAVGTPALTLDVVAAGGTIVAAKDFHSQALLVAEAGLDVTGQADFHNDVDVTGVIVNGNIHLDGVNTISSTAGDLQFTAPGGQTAVFNTSVLPGVALGYNLGSATRLWDTIYLSNSLSDGTNAITMATALSFRDSNVGVADGMALFWNAATSKWLPSIPDIEIQHDTLSGLATGDAHTQYALLAGRSFGQTLNGDVDAGGSLHLHSTAHATKGTVRLYGDVYPGTTGVYDLGSPAYLFDDLYMTGEGKGFRVENFVNVAGLPAPASANKGRLAYTEDYKNVYVDQGLAWRHVGVEKFLQEDDNTVWNGSLTNKIYTVSADISDARTGVWAFYDVTNNYEQVFARITLTQTQVTVDFDLAPPAGTYRLVGVN